MADTQDPPDPEIENPQVVPPVITPTDDPPPDLHDDPPPETVNLSQEDEPEQAQTVADEELHAQGQEIGLSDSDKVGTGEVDDDVPDLVDKMREMVASGRIDMGAFRGERNDDDEEDGLGPDGEEE